MRIAGLPLKITPDFRIATDVWQFQFERRELPQARLRRADKQVTVFLPNDEGYTSLEGQMWLRKVVVETLRRQAHAYLAPRLAYLAQTYGFTYHRLTIKNLGGRWGSCSSLGNINLSLWLMLAPSHLIDYVIKHELAHLREMNHGPRFWREVDRLTDGRGHQLELEMKAFARSLGGPSENAALPLADY